MTDAKRRLAAILAADVAGYSLLMGADEEYTIAALNDRRTIFRNQIASHQGRVVDTAGDSVLATFDSVVEAVRCAHAVQSEIAARNEDVPEGLRMAFRIGINSGDVVEQSDGTIYGDGVNVAARLESLAQPGGIVVSEDAYRNVRNRFGFEDLGTHQVKNIAEPVRAYRLTGMDATSPAQAGRAQSRRKLAILGVVTAIVAALVSWQSLTSLEFGRERAAEKQAEAETDPVLAPPTGPSIAVLPFRNMSGDSEQEFFSDGLTEDIITRFAQFPRFLVIARNSTGQYKGRAMDVRKVGQELGARYLVEGSVRKSGESVRVTAQLIDAEDGTHMWAKTYDRDLTAADLFQVQDEITEQVVGVIADANGILVRAEIAAIKDKPTDSLDAYECVLRTLNYFDAYSPDKHREVRDCLERAVQLDPEYADAWGLLAGVYAEERSLGFNPIEGSLDRALEAGLRSVELDPDGEFGRYKLAQVYFHRNEVDAFFVEADRAIALNPNHSSTLARLGNHMVWAGELERGTVLLKKAIVLNPKHPDWYYLPLGAAHYYRGEYEEALALQKKINMPNFFGAYSFLAMTYGQLGREAEGRATVERLLELYPNFREDFWTIRKHWNRPKAHAEHDAEGLRKAGLDIPERPASLY